MDNSVMIAKNTALVVAGLLAVFVSLGVIAVIFEGLTWQVLGDWTLKGALVGIVVVALGAIIGAIGAATGNKSK